MEWSNAFVLQLIDLYRERECLWNPADNDYKSRSKKIEAWNEISEQINCDTLEVKKKIDSLLSSFRRERQKQDYKAGGDENYKSSWFAFKRMQFLLDKFSTRKSTATDELLDPIGDTLLDIPSPEEVIIKEDPMDSEADVPPSPPSPPPPPPRRKPKLPPRAGGKRQSPNSAALSMLRGAVGRHWQRDASATYGDYVAAKHRNYSKHTQSVLEHLIANILFNADMGNYDKVTHHTYSTQSFNGLS